MYDYPFSGIRMSAQVDGWLSKIRPYAQDAQFRVQKELNSEKKLKNLLT
jgi:hypothetical protein